MATNMQAYNNKMHEPAPIAEIMPEYTAFSLKTAVFLLRHVRGCENYYKGNKEL